LRVRLTVCAALAIVLAVAGLPWATVQPEPFALEAQGPSDGGALLLLNPSTVSPGQGLTIEGVGLPPGKDFEVSISFSDGTVLAIGQSRVDDFGGLKIAVPNIPPYILSGTFEVVARDTDGPEQTKASGYVVARMPTLSVSAGTGNAGERVLFNASGFAPGEQVAAYFNSLGNQPFATFTANEEGNVLDASASMPYGPTGENTIIVMGEQSKAIATASFIVVGFFPTVTLSTYVPRGDEAVGFSGSGFGPNEQVRVYLNSLASSPVKTLLADDSGAFEEPYGFDVPFELENKQTFIFVGESSGTIIPVSFQVAQYSPTVQPSTWSGRPGTVITFYGHGFARNELVRVRRAATQSKPAEEVSCFRTNENGEVGGLGSYIIQATDREGQLDLQLVTEKSQLTLPLSIQVLPAIGDLPAGAIQPNRGCSEVGD